MEIRIRFRNRSSSFPRRFETFETQADVYVNKKRELVAGSHTFKTVLVPRAPGDFTLGPFELWTFDPYKKTFDHVLSQPVDLHVDKGKSPAATAVAPASAQPEDLRLLGEDIHYLKPVGAASTPYAGPVLEQTWFWAAVALPLLAFATLAALRQFQGRLANDVGYRRRRSALRAAQERLSAAARAGDGAEVSRLLELALVGYLSDYFNLPSAIGHEELNEWLLQRGVSAEVVGDFRDLLGQCGFLRFARGVESDGTVDHAVRRAREILGKLQKEVGGR